MGSGLRTTRANSDDFYVWTSIRPHQKSPQNQPAPPRLAAQRFQGNGRKNTTHHGFWIDQEKHVPQHGSRPAASTNRMPPDRAIGHFRQGNFFSFRAASTAHRDAGEHVAASSSADIDMAVPTHQGITQAKKSRPHQAAD